MNYEPVAGPGVWYGRDLARREDWIRPFSAAETAEILAAVEGAKGIPVQELSPANFLLPRLGAVLRGVLVELLEARGFICCAGCRSSV